MFLYRNIQFQELVRYGKRHYSFFIYIFSRLKTLSLEHIYTYFILLYRVCARARARSCFESASRVGGRITFPLPDRTARPIIDCAYQRVIVQAQRNHVGYLCGSQHVFFRDANFPGTKSFYIPIRIALSGSYSLKLMTILLYGYLLHVLQNETKIIKKLCTKIIINARRTNTVIAAVLFENIRYIVRSHLHNILYILDTSAYFCQENQKKKHARTFHTSCP